MSKLFLSVRITENFFTTEEITKIKNQLQNYNNKSDFLRQTIKTYLKLEHKELLTNDSKSNLKSYSKELEELKILIKKNNTLIQELSSNSSEAQLKTNNYKQAYQGDDQEVKTEKILGLLNQF